MDFLLTASGLRNETLREALREMLGRPFGSANVVYVPTASVAESGDHGCCLLKKFPNPQKRSGSRIT
ncbi:hypothetical protein PV338_41930, partial [Streptomyces scabiei]|nr:hypothetical protein [Streptomyces scabiei]